MSGYYGTYRGVVLDAADPAGQHRVLLQVASVLGEQSTWAAAEQPDAALPDIGTEVGVRFEAGDESHPLWTPDAPDREDHGAGNPAATAGYLGTYPGLVLDAADPGGYERVLVSVPEVLGEKSAWAMPEQPGATPPAVGDQVWVRFDGGNVDYPMWTGGSGT